MTVTIELLPEIEAGLSLLAAEQGLALPEYVQHLLAERVPVRMKAPLSPVERAAAWRDVSNLPWTPPLSEEAISRESMYGPRG